MQDQPKLTSAQQELERALRSLPAARAEVDAVGAAFAAGRRSGRRVLRVYQSAVAVLMMTLVVAHGSPGEKATGPVGPETGARGTGYVVEGPARRVPAEVAPQSLLALDRVVRERGVEGLRRSRPSGVRAATVRVGSI